MSRPASKLAALAFLLDFADGVDFPDPIAPNVWTEEYYSAMVQTLMGTAYAGNTAMTEEARLALDSHVTAILEIVKSSVRDAPRPADDDSD